MKCINLSKLTGNIRKDNFDMLHLSALGVFTLILY